MTLLESYACLSGVIPPHCQDFFELSSAERVEKFREYPLERQVDLYLCGMNREPPESGYAVYIAEGGEQVIPYLLRRLEEEPLEITQTRILDIFTVLALKGSLRDKPEVVAELRRVVEKMEYQPIKSKAQQYLQLIEREYSRTTQR